MDFRIFAGMQIPSKFKLGPCGWVKYAPSDTAQGIKKTMSQLDLHQNETTLWLFLCIGGTAVPQYDEVQLGVPYGMRSPRRDSGRPVELWALEGEDGNSGEPRSHAFS